MSSKISSVVFSVEFLRDRIATKLGDASQVAEANVAQVAKALDVLPTADVGTYTTQKKKAGMYLTLEPLAAARFGDGSVFTRIGEADQPVDLDALRQVRDNLATRQADLEGVIAALEAEQSSDE